jgi:outer membrane lipoprotein-sorting protein
MRQIARFVLAFILVADFASGQQVPDSLDVPAAIRAITAYEDTLAHSRITWWSSAFFAGKNIVTNSELSLDGSNQHRKDIERIEGEPAKIKVTVANGETHKVWTGSDSDPVGSGMLFAANSRNAPGLQEYLFRPYASDHMYNFTKVEITGQTKDAISIRRMLEGAIYIDADYIRDGEYLKPRRYQYHPIEKGQVLDGTEFRYEYASGSDGRLNLTRIEQISTIHGVHDSLTISSVDLNPSNDPGLFKFEFPAEAPVRDMR